MDKYSYWLDNIKGIGSKTAILLCNTLRGPQNVYNEKEEVLSNIVDKRMLKELILSKQNWDIDKKYEELLKDNIKYVIYNEDMYPEKLKNIPDYPYIIYYRGKLPANYQKAVALVGARECSEYGKYIAKELGFSLGKANINVISGMARGIDGISQWAALEAGGDSYGVLGCGVDICYPKEHRDLYHSLIESGGVISTYSPKTQPKPSLFPPRNRIVSGLADIIVVVEARQKSGTLITVDMALEQGKEIYAVPGRVTDRLSDGCNQLIKDGANIFISPKQFMDEILPSLKNDIKIQANQLIKLSEGERQILEQLDYYPKSIDMINSRLQLEISCLMGDLMRLVIKGIIKENSVGWFSLVHL